MFNRLPRTSVLYGENGESGERRLAKAFINLTLIKREVFRSPNSRECLFCHRSVLIENPDVHRPPIPRLKSGRRVHS